MAEQEKTVGYCVKCKEKREMNEAQEVAMPGKGGERRAMKESAELAKRGCTRFWERNNPDKIPRFGGFLL